MKRYFAFSIAEAMITLLMISLALAAAAPLLSKQIKNNATGDLQLQRLDNQIKELERQIEELKIERVPSKAVVPFNLANCPNGWHRLTNDYSSANGAFIRNIGGKASSIGVLQEDAAPDLTFQFDIDDNTQNHVGGNMYLGRLGNGRGMNAAGDNLGHILRFAASKASPSYGRNNTTEVRPRNIAFLYCVKD